MTARGLGPYTLGRVYQGDARELGAAVPDGSIDLVARRVISSYNTVTSKKHPHAALTAEGMSKPVRRSAVSDCTPTNHECHQPNTPSINDLQAGKAGEYLVCADLILAGYVSYLSEQGLSYDVVIDYQGRLIRVQVKATRAPTPLPQQKLYTPAYLFNIRRMGKGGRRSYTSEIVDLFALVALDTREIGYFAECDVKQSMSFRVRAYEGQYLDDLRQQKKDRARQMKAEGVPNSQIRAELGVSKSYLSRHLHKESAHKNARYLTDFPVEWALSRLENGHE